MHYFNQIRQIAKRMLLSACLDPGKYLFRMHYPWKGFTSATASLVEMTLLSWSASRS